MKLHYLALGNLALASAVQIIENDSNILKISSQKASAFLGPHSRSKRANTFGEEVKGSDLERECNEEICNYEEISEIFENDFPDGRDDPAFKKKTDDFYAAKTRQCYGHDESGTGCNTPTTVKCVNKWNDFECVCKEGWQGKLCNEDKDECAIADWCANNGICTNSEGSFSCECPRGSEGPRCQEDVDECALGQDTCSNNSTCVNVPITEDARGFTCDCPEGLTGSNCELDINECVETPDICDGLEGERVCINSYGTYNCLCKGGKTGENCEEDLDYCQVYQPCAKFGATCVPGQNSYSCTCPEEKGCDFESHLTNSTWIVVPEVEEVIEEVDNQEIDSQSSNSTETIYEDYSEEPVDNEATYDDEEDFSEESITVEPTEQAFENTEETNNSDSDEITNDADNSINDLSDDYEEVVSTSVDDEEVFNEVSETADPLASSSYYY